MLKRILFAASVTSVIVFAFIQCAPVVKTSNLATSNIEAQASLDLRLRKTDEVRSTLNLVRDAVQPLNAVLRDIGRVVNLQVDGRPGDRLNTFVERFQDLLRESSEGMVEHHAEGSWLIERRFRLDLGREGADCETSKVELVGRRVGSSEQLKLSLTDCSYPEKLEIATIELLENHEVNVTFQPVALERLTSTSYAVGSNDQCAVSIKSDGSSDVVCLPIQVSRGRFTGVINPLHVHSEHGDVSINTKLVINEGERGEVLSAELTSSPGESPRLRVCTRNGCH